jgi:Flp pilus assembly protein TadD
MTGKYRSCKSISIVLAVFFLLAGCNPWENLDGRNPDRDYQSYPGNVSDQDLNQFLSSVKKVDGALEAKYRMARHFQKKSKHKVALIELKEIIQIDPTFVKAYNAIGFSYDCLGDYNKAIRFYKLALKIDPNLDYVHNNLGFAHMLNGDYDSAIEAFHKAVALDEKNKRFRNNLGFAYAKKGQYERAIEHFGMTGDEYSVYYKLGQILYREGNYEMAFRYNEKAHHAKASAKIMSSVSSSDKANGSTGTLHVDEKDGRIESSGVVSDDARKSLKRDEMAPAAARSGLSTSVNENQVSGDENARTKPVIIRKFIKKNSGLAEQKDQEGVRKGKLYIYGTTIDALPTQHSDSSNKQAALKTKSDDLMNPAKNERTQRNTAIIKVEIEFSNGNGVNGMASRLGRYLSEKGFKVTQLSNANSFSHEKTKIFYYNGHLHDVYRLLQEVPHHIDIKNIIELKQKGNRLKILIGKDMIPYESVISSAESVKNRSSFIQAKTD